MRFLVTISLLALLTSCLGSGMEPCADVEGTPVTVTFTLNASQMSSRAQWIDEDVTHPWSDEYSSSDATVWESLITSLQVVAYTPAGERVGAATDINRYDGQRFSARLRNADGAYVMADDVAGKTLRFHFFANSPIDYTYTKDMPTEEVLLSARYSPWFTTSCAYAQEYIPMWGLGTADIPADMEENDGSPIAELGTVWLLRAVAKVEIIIDDSYYQIDKVEVVGSGPSVYCDVPQWTVSGEKSVLSSTLSSTLEFKRASHLLWEKAPDFSVFSTEACPSFTRLIDDKKRCVFYIPEQTNTDDAHVDLSMALSGEDFSHCPLEFRYYDSSGLPTGDRYPIVRNHHYQFTVTVIQNAFRVVATDWDATYENKFTFS